MDSAEGLAGCEGGYCEVVGPTGGGGVGCDFLVKRGGDPAGVGVVLVEEGDGVELAGEVTCPEGGKGDDTCFAVKLDGFFLSKAEGVESADGSSDRSEIAGKSKDRPVLVNGAEISIFSVC